MTDKICFNLFDHETNEEIEGVDFQGLLVKPAVGEILHYWVDHIGTGDWHAPEIRRDFEVKRIIHDLRFMRGSGNSVHMLVIYVTELKTEAHP